MTTQSFNSHRRFLDCVTLRSVYPPQSLRLIKVVSGLSQLPEVLLGKSDVILAF